MSIQLKMKNNYKQLNNKILGGDVLSQNNLKIADAISLDFYNNNIKTINVKQLDSQARYLNITCTEHGKNMKLNSESMIAFVRYKKPDGYYVLNDCDILEDGTLLLEFTQQMTAVSGKATADILILDTSNVTVTKSNEDGIQLSLNSKDDSNGNVVILMETKEDGTTTTIEISNMEDIYNTQFPILSTMTFYANILPTAIEHSEIASSHEYDTLVQGMMRMTELEKGVREAEQTRGFNETDRVEAESKRNIAENGQFDEEGVLIKDGRIQAENKRVESEKARIEAEILRNIAENGTFDEEGKLIKDGRVQAEQKRGLAEEERAKKTAVAISACQAATTACENIINMGIVLKGDIQNNLITTEKGYVLDATQGKLLNDLIISLQKEINEVRNMAQPSFSDDGEGNVVVNL